MDGDQCLNSLHTIYTTKTKLFFQLSIWLLQMREYPYYINFMNAVGADISVNFNSLSQTVLQAQHIL